jgi:hypothetical protein
MINKHSGYCYKCRRYVAPGAGRVWRDGRRWRVAHEGCRGGRGGGFVVGVAEELADPGAAAFADQLERESQEERRREW